MLVARCILRALGRRTGVWHDVETTGRTLALACSWLAAMEITDIYMLRAHRSVHHTDSLVDLALQTQTRIWLIDQQATIPRVHQALEQTHAAETVTAAAFASQCPRSVPSSPTPCRDQLPRLPRVPAPAFLNACLELLAPPAARTVLKQYQSWLIRHRRWLTHRDPKICLRAAIAERIAWSSRDTTDDQDVLLRLMALQNALLESRVLIELDPDAVIMESRSAALLDPMRAERLHQYSSTRYPAVAAAVTVMRRAAGNLTSLTINDLDHATRTLRGRHVPEHHWPFLRAQRPHRLLAGASEQEPLFPGNYRGLDTIRRRVAQETGLPLNVYWSSVHATDDRFLEKPIRISSL